MSLVAPIAKIWKCAHGGPSTFFILTGVPLLPHLEHLAQCYRTDSQQMVLQRTWQMVWPRKSRLIPLSWGSFRVKSSSKPSVQPGMFCLLDFLNDAQSQYLHSSSCGDLALQTVPNKCVPLDQFYHIYKAWGRASALSLKRMRLILKYIRLLTGDILI